jgi:hypothetical protein
VGAFLGLQANGLPSGAQQVPLTDPCGVVKLHSCPLLKVLHAASASAGGFGGPPLPSIGWAERVQHAVSVPKNSVVLSNRQIRVWCLWVVFIK